MTGRCEEISVDVNHDHALTMFSRAFEKIFRQLYTKQYNEIVILCIGTDRSTGDCLGPLVGHKLKLISYNKITVYGTLDQPVHAKNLEDIIRLIKEKHKNPFIIAIDACLGKPERIGKISMGSGPLRPGAGVNKILPEIGHMYIVGVVNMSGFMEYLILQNTRLSLIMRMADTISSGIHFNIWKFLTEEFDQERDLDMELRG
ncbi:MAG: spore protease YyaC [Caldicoprobacterales bacterium]|jgi:putative sporulation protein YyaC